MRLLYWLFSRLSPLQFYTVAPRRRHHSVGFLIGLVILMTVLFLLLRHLYSYYLGAINLSD